MQAGSLAAPARHPMAFHRHIPVQQGQDPSLYVSHSLLDMTRLRSDVSTAIPNLYALQTLHSAKGATALNKTLSADRPALNVFLQVNTSGEDSKSGVPPLARDVPESEADGAELVQIAKHILTECPHLRLQGLMTIGSLSESLSKEKENEDFRRLVATRDALEGALARAGFPKGSGKWGDESGRLLLSMGMSSDFEAALAVGSDIVRVGTGIFGSRPKKEEIKAQS